LCFFNVVFLLLLKHNPTKWCISHGQIAFSPVFDLYHNHSCIISFSTFGSLIVTIQIWFVLTLLLTWMNTVVERFMHVYCSFFIKVKDMFFISKLMFLRAKANASRVFAIVWASVCPSVHLSHSWSVSKRCKLRSRNLHCGLPPGL